MKLLEPWQLQAIRERSTKWMDYAVADCKALLGHVEALEAENRRLRIMLDATQAVYVREHEANTRSSDRNHRELTMPRTAEMFDKPKRPRLVRMHVIDAGTIEGEKAARFYCEKCGTETGWYPCGITEAKRGLPCPECNADQLSEEQS